MSANKQARPLKQRYTNFSQEIISRAREDRLVYRENVAQIRAQIRTARREKRVDDLPVLFAALEGQKSQKARARENTRMTRRAVKEELRVLRAVKSGRVEGAPAYTPLQGDPWETRICNMHKLFPSKNPELSATFSEDLAGIFAGEAPLDALRAKIQECINRACVQPMVADFSLLDALINGIGDNMPSLLRALVDSPMFFQECVSQSYHHDLFEKVVLLGGEESRWKLRMHVFLPSSFTESQEEVHSHRNHFVSRILHGGFTHEVWETAPQRVPESEREDELKNGDVCRLHQYVYNPFVNSAGTRVFNVDKKGTVDMVIVDKASVTRGDSYYMHPSVMHAVTALDGCTVTVVLNAPQTSETSCFATYEEWEEETFERQQFTDEEMRAQLATVCDVLTGAVTLGTAVVRGEHRPSGKNASNENDNA